MLSEVFLLTPPDAAESLKNADTSNEKPTASQVNGK
jgi:hypothetical protein